MEDHAVLWIGAQDIRLLRRSQSHERYSKGMRARILWF